MGQRLPPLRCRDGDRLWLSMLVETMEQVSCPELRGLPCEPSILTGFCAQLALPVSPYPYGVTSFSLRN